MMEKDIEEEINRLASRHIGRLLTRISQRNSIPKDVENGIKAQFRMFQDDILAILGGTKNGAIPRNPTMD